jgi:sugar (pentulose or hexulose) kinase
MVALDESGSVVRPALLWNDTRSAAQAEQIVSEFGSEGITKRTGSVPLASFTATKLAWMKQNEPDLAARVRRGGIASRLADVEASGGTALVVNPAGDLTSRHW